MMALPATMVARLSKKREIRQEMSPVVGFRFFMNAPPQEALKLAGFCQSLTYAGITTISCSLTDDDPRLQGGSGRRARRVGVCYSNTNVRHCLDNFEQSDNTAMFVANTSTRASLLTPMLQNCKSPL